LRTADFDYVLPPELIAQVPAPARDQSRLLVVHRAGQSLEHRHFTDLLDYLRNGDVLVLNDSRVIPARLRGRNPRTGGRFELLLVEETGLNCWWALVRPGRRAQLGGRIELLEAGGKDAGVAAVVEEIAADGRRRLRFVGVENRLGETPLPPYISPTTMEAPHRERYQTVYARADGSVAAPTAGLHFTEALLAQLRATGVRVCFVTLHVGPGTFAPVKTELIAEHRMHEERFEISEETARLVAEAKIRGNRVMAVGTTTLRVLESAARRGSGQLAPGRGRTDIFIHPPDEFMIADSLLTNFHLPRSTLLMLVSAFAAPKEIAGREFILRAYQEAVARRYRFFSYGDAMLLV
jgi:S-adenosylmethionine:tRNA ribosyltransferase-isomerase